MNDTPRRRWLYGEREGGWDGLIKLLGEGAYPKLQTLDLGIKFDETRVRFHLTPEPAARLFASFCRMPHLLHLDLAGHSIGDDGAIALAKALQHTPHLKHLDLSENGIGEAGIIALAKAFKHIPELEFLGLGGMLMAQTGAHALSVNFKHLPRLKNFALPFTHKRTILSRLATDLPMLQFLTISESFDRYDARILGEQLGGLSKLELLDLRLPRWGARAVTNMVEAANRGRGTPAHVRVTEKHTHCCEGWRKALPTHGLPEEKFKRTEIKYDNDSEDKSKWTRVLEFHLPGAKGICFATQWGYDY